MRRGADVGGRRLATNTAWNFGGIALPAMLALLTIPLLIDAMGTARVGVLSLAWATVGYFSLFDMGFGRAMTQMIARQLGSDDHHGISSTFWTGMTLVGLLGVAGGGTLALCADRLVRSVLEIPESLEAEALRGLYVIAAGLPIVVTSAGLQGVVEAHQDFRTVFIVKVLQGTVTFAGPLLAVQFTTDLAYVIATLVVGRMASWVLLARRCIMTVEDLGAVRFDPTLVPTMASFGGWMSVSNVLEPVLVYADRLLIGGMLSIAAVAYYATPSEMVLRLLIVPNALLGVMFPVFAALTTRPHGELSRLFASSVRYVFLVMFPVCLLGIGLASPLLELWLGPEFATESCRAMQWLLVGILFNGIAHMPSGLIAAAGRPDITAKVHIVEAPIYVALLWLLIEEWGIEGAAITWTLRVAADCLVLTWFGARLVNSHAGAGKTAITGLVALVVLIAVVLLPTSDDLQIWLSVMITFTFAGLGWTRLLDVGERAFVRRGVTRWISRRNAR